MWSAVVVFVVGAVGLYVEAVAATLMNVAAVAPRRASEVGIGRSKPIVVGSVEPVGALSVAAKTEAR